MDATVESDAEEVTRKAKRQRLILTGSSSSESKEYEQGDTGNSSTQSPSKSHPLSASPLASRPSTASSAASRLGVFALGNDPDSDEEDEPRFDL